MTITYEPKKIIFFLSLIVIGLIIGHIAGTISSFYLGGDDFEIFNLDIEQNIPSLYSSLSLMLCAGILYLIANITKRQGKRDYLYWAGLSVIFVFLSIDEMTEIHERLIIPLRNMLNTSGVLFFAWVIPYGILLIAMLMFYFRFIVSLPVRIRLLFILAGSLYIGGAVVMESLGGSWFEQHGDNSLFYSLIILVEETLEMTGILVFIYALLSYIDTELQGVYLYIKSAE